MEGFSFVTPVTGLNRPNTGKEDDDDDDPVSEVCAERENWTLYAVSVSPYRWSSAVSVLTKELKLSHHTPRRQLGERRYSSYSF
jgi:hypothetical protein